MIAVVIVGGLLLMTSLGVMLAVVRRCRRLKLDAADRGSDVRRHIQLDDLLKLLCHSGRRRRRRGAGGQGAKPPSADQTGTGQQQQQQQLLEHSELVQLVLLSQTGANGAGLMQENDRYSSAADINTTGASSSSLLLLSPARKLYFHWR